MLVNRYFVLINKYEEMVNKGLATKVEEGDSTIYYMNDIAVFECKTMWIIK